MFSKLFKWFLALFRSKSRYVEEDLSYKYEFVEDIPDFPTVRTLYFIGEQNYYWQFVMLCPCGCNSLLHMNLMEDEWPHWEYKIFDDLISISPSIDRKVGCKSHFFIRDSTIQWT